PLLRECLAAAAGPARQRLLEERLRGMDEAYHYAAAFLVGPGGELLAAAGAKPPDAFEQAAGRDAWDGPATRVVWDVLSSSSGPSLRLDFVAAILAGSPARRRATLVLRTDPASVTAAILGSWPNASPSGETLLVARRGDQILFLNRTRRPGAPVLEASLERRELVGVKGVLEGDGL